MPALYTLSVWLHVLAACAWVGGMVFLVVVLVPLLRRPELSAVASMLISGSGRRFRALGWVCLVTLVVTGTVNMAYRGLEWSAFFDGRFATSPLGRALALKLALVAAVLGLSAVHDFWLGPKAVQRWLEQPDSAQAAQGRRRAAWMGRVNGALALAIVLLAVLVARGGVTW